eukprot:sb/3473848/
MYITLSYGSPKTVRKLFKTGISKLDCSPPDGTDGSDRESFEALSPSSKERFLTNMCGVVSGYTKKLCTRSLRCPQHTDEQRATARSLLLLHHLQNNEETGFNNDIPYSRFLRNALGRNFFYKKLLKWKSQNSGTQNKTPLTCLVS